MACACRLPLRRKHLPFACAVVPPCLWGSSCLLAGCSFLFVGRSPLLVGCFLLLVGRSLNFGWRYCKLVGCSFILEYRSRSVVRLFPPCLQVALPCLKVVLPCLGVVPFRFGRCSLLHRHTTRTFSLSQMNNVELVRTLSWWENALFEEREKNVFVNPNEQCRACSNIVMASKRTFRGMRKNSKTHQPTNSSTQKLKIFVFILQRHVIFHSVLAKIGVKK